MNKKSKRADEKKKDMQTKLITLSKDTATKIKIGRQPDRKTQKGKIRGYEKNGNSNKSIPRNKETRSIQKENQTVEKTPRRGYRKTSTRQKGLWTVRKETRTVI